MGTVIDFVTLLVVMIREHLDLHAVRWETHDTDILGPWLNVLALDSVERLHESYCCV